LGERLTISDRLFDLWRRLFGRFTLDDPRPIAKEAPYTFHLPLDAELEAIRPGDFVKLMFRGAPAGREWAVERMWVIVTAVSPKGLSGVLDNDPSDMPQLKAGTKINFERHHVISVRLEGPDRPTIKDDRPEYWARCMVDDCVLAGERPVGYLYREEPDLAEEGDKYPDSGWRIRGDLRDQTEEQIGARKASYVALGAVLNRDDSWLNLIDLPVGAAFDRDFETGRYVPTEASDGPELV
jgi:hypothetical protein